MRTHVDVRIAVPFSCAPLRHFGAVCQRDRHRVERVAVDEVRRAVDRIDDPPLRFLVDSGAGADLADDFARLGADDRLVGKRGAQRGDDRVLGFGLRLGGDVAVILRVRGAPAQVARRVEDHRRRAVRCAYGHGEDGVVGHDFDLAGVKGDYFLAPSSSSCSICR
jgi:hypothetical protein